MDQIKGSLIHLLKGSCLGYRVIPYFCGSDVRCQCYINPSAKKSSIFTSTDCATDLPSRLSAACVSFDLPPLPSMAGDYILSIEISLAVAIGSKKGQQKKRDTVQ